MFLRNQKKLKIYEKIFCILGRAVALAFRSQGYTVYGLVRSEEKAKEAKLMQEEIIPVIGDPNKPEDF